MEAIMKKLLFGAATAAAMLVAGSPALAHSQGPSWRSDASDKAPPVLGTAFPVCHVARERPQDEPVFYEMAFDRSIRDDGRAPKHR
jgi:hypothetical protein